MPPSRTPPDPRKVAPVIWGALLASQVLFLVVASFARSGMPPADPRLTRILLVVAAVLAAVTVLLSRLLPPRLPRAPGVSQDQAALNRTIVASALCEGAGLFCIVVFLVTGSPVALAILVLPLAALAASWPGDARWEALGGGPGPGGAPPRR